MKGLNDWVKEMNSLFENSLYDQLNKGLYINLYIAFINNYQGERV